MKPERCASENAGTLGPRRQFTPTVIIWALVTTVSLVLMPILVAVAVQAVWTGVFVARRDVSSAAASAVVGTVILALGLLWGYVLGA